MGQPAQFDRNLLFFSVRIHSIPTGSPLPYDVYLWIDGHAVLFRRRRDVLSPDRIERLRADGVKELLVPDDHRQLYINSLIEHIRNPDLKTDIRAKYIKETAYVHVHDLFTNENVAKAIEDSKTLVEEMVKFIADDIEAATSLMRLSNHDYYTYNHSVNVAVYCIALAKHLYGDDKILLLAAGFGGLLHDIGKRKIDLAVLNKPGKLDPKEWQIVKKHPEYGGEYLKPYSHVPEESKIMVRSHHENFDGTGYPDGLKEDQISELSRLCAIADVFDALTTNRSYRGAMTPEQALEVMYSMQPGKFDPSMFRKFNKDFEKRGHVKFENDFDPCDAHRSRRIKKV